MFDHTSLCDTAPMVDNAGSENPSDADDRGCAPVADEGALVDAVTHAVSLPLLLVSGGDPAAAFDRWRAIRASVDDAVKERLQLPPAEQGQALLSAVSVSLATGIDGSETLAQRALKEAVDPLARADAHRALAKIGTWRGDVLRTAESTRHAAMAVAPFDARRCAELHLDAATALLNAGHLGLAEAAALDAESSSAPWADLHPTAKALVGITRIFRGEPAPLAVPGEADLDALGADDVRLGVLVGGLLVTAGRHREARSLLARTEATARSTAPAALPFVLAVQADLDLRSGWWHSAHEAAEQGEAHASRSSSHNMRAIVLVRGARIAAARGDVDGCLTRLAAVDRIEPGGALINVRLHAASVRSFLAMGEGDHEAAVAHAERARQVAGVMTLRHPGVDDFHGDLVEALVRTDQPDRAAQVLDDLEQMATRLNHHPSLAVAARGRMLLCDYEAVESVASVAMSHHHDVQIPFELARTNLVLGEVRRRAGRRRDARVVLGKAHAEFARLGARPWADRALNELRAAGGRVTGHVGVPAALGILSPQEQAVAWVVADGATNQEAASALFLSQKSIERHLTTIYRKVGLRSRTELARWVDVTSRSAREAGGDAN